MVVRIEDLAKSHVSKPKFVSRKEREALKKSKEKLKSIILPKAVATPPTIAAPLQKEPIPEYSSDSEPEEIDEVAPMSAGWRSKQLSDMTDRDWRLMKQELGLAIEPFDKFTETSKPLLQWTELDPRVSSVVAEIGYGDPTPVQRAAIPQALANMDVIAIAETGSGKTASFAIPLCIKTAKSLESSGGVPGTFVRSVILAPTRELALQISTELVKFAKPLGLASVALVGGHDIYAQANEIADGADIIVATPGRLVDFLTQNLLVLTSCSTLVLDEADRMVDLGFADQLERILQSFDTAKRPQTMMYSATWSTSIAEIAQKYLLNPTKVTIQQAAVNDRVDQVVQLTTAAATSARSPQIASALSRYTRNGKFPAIVFANSRQTVDQLTESLLAKGIRAAAMHGARAQEEREATLAALRAGATNVLVATDVAARGIDVPGIALVVNAELPPAMETYIHRIGRTGRAGRTGTAVTLVSEQDKEKFAQLRAILRKGGCKIPNFLK